MKIVILTRRGMKAIHICAKMTSRIRRHAILIRRLIFRGASQIHRPPPHTPIPNPILVQNLHPHYTLTQATMKRPRMQRPLLLEAMRKDLALVLMFHLSKYAQITTRNMVPERTSSLPFRFFQQMLHLRSPQATALRTTTITKPTIRRIMFLTFILILTGTTVHMKVTATICGVFFCMLWLWVFKQSSRTLSFDGLHRTL
jgi:hypothetical protein